MTEVAFQHARKVMQKANYWRGEITSRKGEVAKWTAIEASHLENLRPAQAEAARKMLEKKIARLQEAREVFAAMVFPDPNMVEVVERCQECHRKVHECTCNDY